MLKQVTTFFRIQNGQFIFLNRNEDDFQQFLKDNEGKRGVREYRIEEDSVKHSQHKYYRGYLIPPIARECFDGDEYRTHLEMKKIFLFRDVRDYGEIPEKHKARCIPIWRTNPDGEEIIIGYLPSTGDVTRKEMNEYILNVEQFSFEMAMNAIPPEGIEIRNRALEINET